jgi:excisionase family DNA binding protein
MSDFEGWLNTNEAAALTGYSQAYARRLAREGRVEARRAGRDWLLNEEDLLAFKAQMDKLGPDKHNPWRDDLQEGRGRRDTENGG